jgi:hypothetical protein
MAKIFIPACNEHREIDQIVSFGCSMTAGTELLDQERFPMIADVESAKRKVDGEDWRKLIKGKCTIDHWLAIQEKERQLAWPNQLGQLYNIPVYNFAEGASSFEKQITQFTKYKKLGYITPTTLVIWGFTQHVRGLWLQNTEVTSYMLNGAVVPKDVTNDINPFWITKLHSDSMLLWKYYQCLSIVFGWAKDICNDQFMFVQALPVHLDYDHMPKWEQEKFTKPELIEHLRNYWDILRNDYDNRYPIFKNYDYQNLFKWTEIYGVRLAHRHPDLETHKKYANLIYNRLEILGSNHTPESWLRSNG